MTENNEVRGLTPDEIKAACGYIVFIIQNFSSLLFNVCLIRLGL